jgi:hypothetical protein
VELTAFAGALGAVLCCAVAAIAAALLGRSAMRTRRRANLKDDEISVLTSGRSLELLDDLSERGVVAEGLAAMHPDGSGVRVEDGDPG